MFRRFKLDKISFQATGCPPFPLCILNVFIGLAVTIPLVLLVDEGIYEGYLWMPWVLPQNIYWPLFWYFCSQRKKKIFLTLHEWNR